MGLAPACKGLGEGGGGQTHRPCPQLDHFHSIHNVSTLLFNHHFPKTISVPRSCSHGTHSLQESNGPKRNQWHTGSRRDLQGGLVRKGSLEEVLWKSQEGLSEERQGRASACRQEQQRQRADTREKWRTMAPQAHQLCEGRSLHTARLMAA